MVSSPSTPGARALLPTGAARLRRGRGPCRRAPQNWWPRVPWGAPGLDLGHTEGTPPINWPRQQTNPRPLTWGFSLERVTRIELALSAWEATALASALPI